jgi:hypothetical protein
MAKAPMSSGSVARGIKDWDLLKIVLEGDWTLVTRNAYDICGPEAAPGTRGQYQRAEIHAGLICLNGPEGMDLDMQRDLFEAVLDELDRDSDLVNVVLELAWRRLNPMRLSSTATRSRRIKKVENRPLFVRTM